MSEPVTAAGAALVYELTMDEETEEGAASWRRSITAVEAEAAARAVDEALSVERVESEVVMHRPDSFDGRCDCGAQSPNETWNHHLAAALVAHLRGPR